MQASAHPVLLFDGVCNLCSNAVQFVIKRDPSGHIRFASLQSPEGQAILSAYALPAQALKSLVFIENGQAYTQSTGALRLARYLTGGWPLLYLFIIVPPFIRNAVYNWVGKNRYRWFGKKATCWIPAADLRARFIDQA